VCSPPLCARGREGAGVTAIDAALSPRRVPRLCLVRRCLGHILALSPPRGVVDVVPGYPLRSCRPPTHQPPSTTIHTLRRAAAQAAAEVNKDDVKAAVDVLLALKAQLLEAEAAE
jgi:hypothetical protein